MVVLPPGKFIMGSLKNESGLDASERPQREVTITKPFAISKFEVTFDNWDACVAATACREVPDSWGRGGMPVINVSWRDAKQYVGWLSRRFLAQRNRINRRRHPPRAPRQRRVRYPRLPGGQVVDHRLKAQRNPKIRAAIAYLVFLDPVREGSRRPR
jgi:Sulfatase-modifying factor enzyme 1